MTMMTEITENDKIVATYLLCKIAIADYIRYGMYDTNWANATNEYEDRFTYGFDVFLPNYTVDSDFTMAFSLNSFYDVTTLFDICEIDDFSYDGRNDFLIDCREWFILPDSRKSRTADCAFGFSYEELARPLLEMTNIDGIFDSSLQIYDRMIQE